MKKSNELKYDIIASYNPRVDETSHLIIFKDNNEMFQIPNIIIDYEVKFHKACPKYKISSYTDLMYDRKSNKIYMMLTSKGNPFKIKENNKDVRIILYDVEEANIYKAELPKYYQFPAPYTSYPTF